jgi:alkanesulfonate monooxygenase SsuD/methylene tetrahydromethanopterin reductase-like flavin-dependent oxidoreductase (luciferase family)
VLSGGRAYLGIGAAWNEREHRGLGVPFPPLKERFERLEETLQIAKQMWSGEVGSYQGTHYQLAETLNSPPALSRPHPPILIGGSGEKKTLRLVARYGDACNLTAGTLDVGPSGPTWRDDLTELRHKLDVLREHCAAEGRSFASIEKTTAGLPVTRQGGGLSLTPAQAVDQLGRLAELGIDHHIFGTGVEDRETIELIATEVIPQLDRVPVAAA